MKRKKEREKKIYDFCLDYMKENEDPPMLKDIAEELNVSKQRVNQILERMVKDGHMTRRSKKGSWRNYIPIKSPK